MTFTDIALIALAFAILGGISWWAAPAFPGFAAGVYSIFSMQIPMDVTR